MDTEEASRLIADLLDAPDELVRARHLLRGLSDLHRAAQGDLWWWTSRGGLSDREATRLYAAFQLHATLQASRPPAAITGPEELVRALCPLASRAQEELWVVTVDGALRPMNRARIAVGGRIAVVDQATGFFLAHNHPSGDPRPSSADERFTNQVNRGGKTLGLQLHDHIIMTSREWVSERTGSRGSIDPSPRSLLRVSDSP